MIQMGCTGVSELGPSTQAANLDRQLPEGKVQTFWKPGPQQVPGYRLGGATSAMLSAPLTPPPTPRFEYWYFLPS